MSSFIRLLKLAEKIADSGDIDAFNSICAQLNCYIRKNAHYEAKNDGTTPNIWKKNLDYGEESPYYGSMSEFMEKFPNGIKDWIEWRKKNKKNRFKEYGIKERTAHLKDLMKNSHYEPVGPDNTKDFPSESKLWGDMDKFKSIKEFIEKHKKEGQSADDAVEDFIDYWKLLRKSKERRK